MNSQWIDTLFRLNGETSSPAGSSISANRPCGAISLPISARCASVLVVENTNAGAPRPEPLDLAGERLGMVDDVVGAELAAPGRRLGPRGCGDHRQVGELPGELGRDRADPAGAADDQDGVGDARHRLADVEPVEQRLPGGDRGERQGRGLGDARARRVCGRRSARRPDGTRRSSPAGRAPRHRTRRRPAEQASPPAPAASTVPAASQPSTFHCPASGWARIRTLVSTGLTETASTRTRMSWPVGLRPRQLDVVQGSRIADGKRGLVADGAHGRSSCCW